MFEHVEHQNERVTLARLERFIEWLHVDFCAMFAARTDEIVRRLHTLHLPERFQAAEEKPVAAAHVENSQVGARAEPPTQHFENGLFARTPPPVSLVQFAVLSAVIRIQSAPRCECAAKRRRFQCRSNSLKLTFFWADKNSSELWAAGYLAE